MVACRVCMLSRVRLFAVSRTVAHEAPLSMGFSRQEYWSRLPFPSLGDPPSPGVEPTSPEVLAWQVGSLPLSHLGSLPGVVLTTEVYSWERARGRISAGKDRWSL